MPKFKAYVKVPADSKGSLKRIVTKTISADNLRYKINNISKIIKELKANK